jgi:hypothetical protein
LPVNDGGVRSLVHVTVLAAVAELPQPSEAVNVLVCERRHPLELMLPSTEEIVGVPQPSVAVAEPSAAFTSAGLQPRSVVVYDPVNTGGVLSAVQVTVLAAVALLLQPSTAVNVLVCERRHPLEVITPSF